MSNATTTVRRQYHDGKKFNAWEIALAVAAEIKRLGYDADAVKGPIYSSPDDEPTVHCAHVATTQEGWGAYDASRAAARKS